MEQLSYSELFSKGNELYKTGNFLDAFNYYTKAEENTKYKLLKITTLFNAGLCKLHLEEFSESISIFKKVLNLDPKYDKAFYNMGVAYYNIGDKKGALRNLNMSWALNGNDAACEDAINLVLNKYKRTV